MFGLNLRCQTARKNQHIAVAVAYREISLSVDPISGLYQHFLLQRSNDRVHSSTMKLRLAEPAGLALVFTMIH